MSKDHFQLNDANNYKHGLEDILQESPSLKWALCYAKIDLTKWSVNDWLIHARVKLDVDVDLGYFPLNYRLEDMDCYGAIGFLSILAYPKKTDAEKRLKFSLATHSLLLKRLGLKANSRVRGAFNQNGWNLTSIKKIEFATRNGVKRINNSLRLAKAMEHYLKDQVIHNGSHPKSFTQALYQSMEQYLSEKVQKGSKPYDTDSNLQASYKKSKQILHYAIALSQVWELGEEPLDIIPRILSCDWLPKVLANGNNFLATEYEASRSLDLPYGDTLYEFSSADKVYIFQ